MPRYLQYFFSQALNKDCSDFKRFGLSIVWGIRTWEARTRHRRCRTRVRRAGDAAAHASGRVGPRGSHVRFFDARRREPIRLRGAPTRADSGRIELESAGIGQNRPISVGIGRYRPESAGIGRNSRFRPKFKKKKKKKKPRTHRLLNSNSTSAQMHSKRQKHSSHYISLTLLSALVAL